MASGNKFVRYLKVSFGSLAVIAIWWITITGYSIGDPVDPTMLFWGLVFVFGAIFGPVIGLLVWPLLLHRLFIRPKKAGHPK